MREEEIERLRGVVRDSVSKHLYSSAIFFADKVAAFTGDPADIYMQAQALFLGRHFRRAFHLLNASQIVLRDLRFRYLAAKCLEELKEWDQCLQMLGDAEVDEHGNVSDFKDVNSMYLDKEGQDHEINISAAICFLRATNFLHPPFILPAKPEPDEKERARHQPKVEMAHRSSHHQNHRHLQAVLETGLQKQCAGENPARLRSPKQFPATDMPAQREPAGTETADQPSRHFNRVETHPPETRSEKFT
ncbi:hypothetical protein Cgig2_022663 [Carnegiea gigantea]|uniref:Anaphase-promoting complex subunit 6 n=1 Tax=Carnegiea gigantea TaxID=171969 RepID=A0A9Q1JJL6_9CARY|nr:hypothetical protein Cgig2_022663 [Carnegiea gigantea]